MLQLIELVDDSIFLFSVYNYPVHDFESVEEVAQSLYFYGDFYFGGGLRRTVIAYPEVINYNKDHRNPLEDEDSVSSGGSTANSKLGINTRVCILPGLGNLSQFKESLKSTTFVLELHQEDVGKRAFHSRNVTEYNNIGVDKLEAASTSKAGTPKVKPKAVTPSGKRQSAKSLTASSPEKATESDEFLLNAIAKALSTSRQLRPHGTIRFRLEQLLSSSNDMLKKFASRQQHSKDNTISVQEEMELEVRLEKPSKPDKWDLPPDISLKSALARVSAEKQSQLDGTLAVNSTMNTQKLLKKIPPRHELFSKFGTYIDLSVELKRKLLDDKTLAEEKLVLVNPLGGVKDGKSVELSDTTIPVADLYQLSIDALHKKLAVTPFTRMVVVFKYIDDDTLLGLDEAIAKVNSKALPDIQGSLRSYSYTPKQLEASIKGKLDVISGFMIIDDDIRMVVLEGLAGPGLGMQSIFVDLPRQKENDNKLKILCNPEVLFAERAYPEFGPDLRRIRVRDKMKKLARKPEIYNRNQVDELCFSGIDSIMSLRRAADLRSTKELNMYPSAEALGKIELLYGEGISRADMDGTNLRKLAQSNEDKAVAKRVKSAFDEAVDIKNIHLRNSSSRGSLLSEAKPATVTRKRDEYVPTDCRNERFEETLRTRPAHRVDYLGEQKTLRQEAWMAMLRRREMRDQELNATINSVLGEGTGTFPVGADADRTSGPKIYLYSQQSLNYKSKAFSQLRERVGADKNATYSFSKDFISQTVVAVDEEAIAKKKSSGRGEDKTKWKSKEGFLYPKPKTRTELITHPNRPSDARIEELHEPFTDQTDVKKGVTMTDDPEELRKRELERGYITQIKAGGDFGALEPAQFEREFQLRLVGDRNKLPRGLQTAGDAKDKDFFKSVHLAGEEKTKILEDAKAQEKAEWEAKVVVDHTDFKVGGYNVRDFPIQADRTNDILKGEANRLALKQLRDRKSHKLTDFSYKPAPLSMFSTGPYVQNEAANALVRTTNKTKFITASMQNSSDSTSVNLEDFKLYIHKDANSTPLMAAIAKRKHPPLDKANSKECVGPKWEAPSSSMRTSDHKESK